MSTDNPAEHGIDPAAYTCEWCPEDDANTADRFTWTKPAHRPDGDWVPTCADCREWALAFDGPPRERGD